MHRILHNGSQCPPRPSSSLVILSASARSRLSTSSAIGHWQTTSISIPLRVCAFLWKCRNYHTAHSPIWDWHEEPPPIGVSLHLIYVRRGNWPAYALEFDDGGSGARVGAEALSVDCEVAVYDDLDGSVCEGLSFSSKPGRWPTRLGSMGAHQAES
jgi:hypothetical protein